MTPNRKPKTINEEIKRLENERLKLQEDKEKLACKAVSLRNELMRLQSDYSSWNQRTDNWLKYLVVIFFFTLAFVYPILGMHFFTQLPRDAGLLPLLLAFLICIVPFILILTLLLRLNSYMANKFRIQYTNLSAEFNNVQSQIMEKNTQISEISHRINEIRRKREEERERRFELRQNKRGLFKFVDRHGNVRWGTPNQVKLWRTMDWDMKNHFRRLTPREFEEFIRKLFVEMGYQTSLTSYTADFGADLIAKKGDDTIVIQVKKFDIKNKVGSPEIQRLLGSMFKYKANKAIFVTTSDFTKEARELARDAPIELWNYAILNEKIEKYLLKF